MMHSDIANAAGYGGPPGGYGPPGGGYGGGGYGGAGGGGYGGGGGGGYGPPPPGGFGPPPPGPGMGGPQFPPPMGPMMPQPSSGLAIGALVCGIISIPGACCCYSSVPFGIAAIIMGIIAMQKAKNTPQTHGGRGMALGGLVCGIVGFSLTFVMFALGMSMQAMQAIQNGH